MAGVVLAVMASGFTAAADADPSTRPSTRSPAAAERAPSFRPCADVLFVGARGAGQKAGQNNGFGPHVANILQKLVQRLGGDRSVAAFAVNYPAPKPGVLLASRKGLSKYTNGVSKGVNQTRTLLTQHQQGCPEQTIVLAGFSQGAMVMHQVLAKIAKDDQISGRIAGVILLADGNREKNTKAKRYGSAPKNGFGVRHLLGSQPVPKSLAARTHTVCLKGDIICDTSALLGKKLKGKKKVKPAVLVKALLAVPEKKATKSTAVHLGPAYRGNAKAVRTPVNRTAEAALDRPPHGAAGIAAGNSHTCALDNGGTAWCWGYNGEGQLGDGTTVDHVAPAEVAGDHTFTMLAARLAHSCGLDASGAAWCWGYNSLGQLGDGSNTQREVPVVVAGGHSFDVLAAGDMHTCGIDTDGQAWCWGYNVDGQLGDGTTGTQNSPVQVEGSHTFTTLALGDSHTCGIDTEGQAWCWGRNSNGRLGDGTTDPSSTPVQVAGGHNFATLAAGTSHTCGVDTEGQAWCWGNNQWGQLGDGTTDAATVPVEVTGGIDFTSLAAGYDHTCGKDVDGQAWCWGNNHRGQLGDGTTEDRWSPTQVTDATTFAAVTAGRDHTCGIAVGGELWCWGRNDTGQLGDGSTVDRSAPVQVVLPD